jgi:Transposase, Mutator family
MLTVFQDQESSNENDAGVGRSLLDEIVRDGARQMLAAALQSEVATYIDQFADQVDENGYRLVVRNGYHRERGVLTAAGAVTVAAPRVNDRRVDADTGERRRFTSAILPAWARKSPQMNEVLPLLYLHGLSTGDFGAALEQFLGAGAGLSAASITRLTAQWQDEAKSFQERDLGHRFRVPVGRPLPPQSPARAGETVPAGDDRCPHRRPQRAGHVERRLPGVQRVVGRPAARLPPPRDDRAGAGRGRRCAGILEDAARGVPEYS